ncbi:MAG: VCBS repeat-containing protein, partial [Myxococcales bacterium]|nr:VCBS repeat-containing protein [Myxococcales bacterium]
TARESISNPVVADVDGDGAAEILVASSQPISYSGEPELPTGKTLMLIANEGGSFAPTRRVWNQHTYHHSNVREDARVPTHENPHWQSENSFRTNVAAAGSMDVCIPPGS